MIHLDVRYYYGRNINKLGRRRNPLKKHNRNEKKEVKQKLVRNKNLIEFVKLYIILTKQKDNKKLEKQYDLYEQFKTLNPKYSELKMTPIEHKLKVDLSDIIYSSKYNFLGLF
jgi:hypothetical protein